MPDQGNILHNSCALDRVEWAPVGNPICCPEEACGMCHGDDLVIFDVAGTDYDGRDVIRGVRQTNAMAQKPRLVVSLPERKIASILECRWSSTT